jgi:hypothetical protein
MRKLLAIAFVLVAPLLAEDRAKQPVATTYTERFNVPAAGTIRIENSFGEVDVEGWDRPEVETTLLRSSEDLYDAKESAQGQRRLDRVQITAKQDGNDVVISTAYSPRKSFLHPLSRRSDIEIGYRIKAPHASKLIIDHNSGGVNIVDISGDIHATVTNGQITLTLAADGQYAMDAQTKFGNVYSDFEGHGQREHVLGEEFGHQSRAPATNLFLRVRFGDIVILKLHGPPTD